MDRYLNRISLFYGSTHFSLSLNKTSETTIEGVYVMYNVYEFNWNRFNVRKKKSETYKNFKYHRGSIFKHDKKMAF